MPARRNQTDGTAAHRAKTLDAMFVTRIELDGVRNPPLILTARCNRCGKRTDGVAREIDIEAARHRVLDLLEAHDCSR